MNNNIFQFTGQLPQTPAEITIFLTGQSKTQREENIKQISQTVPQLFGMDGVLADYGDRFIGTKDNKRIMVYAATDSFWYQDEDFSLSENKELSKNLPDPQTAGQVALGFLKSGNLLLPEASVHSTTYTQVAKKTLQPQKVEEYKTEVHVNLRYTLKGLPVFGPGAKTRVSLVNANVKSSVYHFWRKATADTKTRKLIDPQTALNSFYENFRFAQLKNNPTAKVTVSKMELGYFANPPTHFQNYLIPVYKVNGVVSTTEFPQYEFELFIVAVNYAISEMRSMGLTNRGQIERVF
jgi:hypothetical protein